jgi:hypothetical protein
VKDARVAAAKFQSHCAFEPDNPAPGVKDVVAFATGVAES